MHSPRALSPVDPLRTDKSDLLLRGGAEKFEKLLTTKSESFWIERGGEKALSLFHAAAERVPAYKDFLKRRSIKHAQIKSIKDFAKVPVTDAKNYIAEYPAAKRCWDGNLSAAKFIAMSSGTTGEPKFWAREAKQDFEAAVIHEWLYRSYFKVDKRSTLLLIGFPMGIYISGMATVLPSWLTSLGNNLTVMSVGNNKAEMLRVVRNLSDNYQQTIIIGHPFFIKDVIESGEREGVAWAEKHLGLMFCSEGFSESWRAYVAKKAGMPAAAPRIFNTYGSSEMLLMAYETPLTIGIKALAEKNSQFLAALTSDTVPPQFFQYNPLLRYIESVEKELVFTAASGMPLIRFNLHDRGEVFSLKHLKETINLPTLKSAYQLPLLTLWGRNNDTLKFHGANIYPEHIKAGLANKRFLRQLTGKFVMEKSLDKKMNQVFGVTIELCPGVTPARSLEREIQKSITQKLRKVNLEYLDMSTHLDVDARPHISLRTYQDPEYFKPGLKPRYIKRA